MTKLSRRYCVSTLSFPLLQCRQRSPRAEVGAAGGESAAAAMDFEDKGPLGWQCQSSVSNADLGTAVRPVESRLGILDPYIFSRTYVSYVRRLF